MVPSPAPTVVVLGGPNGAGKSTTAPRLLRGTLRVDEFVNADTLAQGLSAFRPEAAAVDAGRIMLRRLDQLAANRSSFAFESTLASLGLAHRLSALEAVGYHSHLLYLWLPDVALALARIAERVRMGGHDVPADTVRRRFERSRRNFFQRYQQIARRWRLYDASVLAGPRLIARGGRGRQARILDDEAWRLVSRPTGPGH
ncbi:MAG: zeta toxin family protein [Acidobacteriota bacterium]